MGANSVCCENQSSKDLASTERRELFQMQLLGWGDRNALLAALAKPTVVSRQPAALAVSRPTDRRRPHRGMKSQKEFKFYPYIDPGAYIIQYRLDCSSVSTQGERQAPLEMFALIGECARNHMTLDVIESENGPAETAEQLSSVAQRDGCINDSSVSQFKALNTVSVPPVQNESELVSCGMETGRADATADIKSLTVSSDKRHCDQPRAVRLTGRDQHFAESLLTHQKKRCGGSKHVASAAPSIVAKHTPAREDVGKYLFLTGTNVTMQHHDALMSLALSTAANTSRNTEELCNRSHSSVINKTFSATYLQPLVSRSRMAQPKLHRNYLRPKIKGEKVKNFPAPKQTNVSNSSFPLNVRDGSDPNFAEVLFVKLLQVVQCQRHRNSPDALDITKSEATEPLEEFEQVQSNANPADASDACHLGRRKSAERDSTGATAIRKFHNAPINEGIASETHEKQGVLQLSSLPCLAGTATTKEYTSTTKSKNDKPQWVCTSVLYGRANHLRKKSSSATLSTMYKTYVDKTRDLIHPLRSKSCFSDSVFRKRITIPWRLKLKDHQMPDQRNILNHN